jgi:hypothetical protein
MVARSNRRRATNAPTAATAATAATQAPVPKSSGNWPASASVPPAADEPLSELRCRTAEPARHGQDDAHLMGGPTTGSSFRPSLDRAACPCGGASADPAWSRAPQGCAGIRGPGRPGPWLELPAVAKPPAPHASCARPPARMRLAAVGPYRRATRGSPAATAGAGDLTALRPTLATERSLIVAVQHPSVRCYEAASAFRPRNASPRQQLAAEPPCVIVRRGLIARGEHDDALAAGDRGPFG